MKPNDGDQDDDALGALIRRHATRHGASEALRASVRTQIALLDAARPVATAPAAPATDARPPLAAGRWRTAALGFAAGVAMSVLVGSVMVLWPHWQATRLDDDTLVAAHVRALREGPLVAVASNDKHNVKPWFQGRLDYAPSVPDLAEDGFPLQGGRVETVRGQAVAVLVYRHGGHVVEVFVRPAGDEAASGATPAGGTLRGFVLRRWGDGTMRCALVSDIEAAEAERFVQVWQRRAAAAR